MENQSGKTLMCMQYGMNNKSQFVGRLEGGENGCDHHRSLAYGQDRPGAEAAGKYKYPYLSIDHLKIGLIRA